MSRHNSGIWAMRSTASGDSPRGYVAPYSGTIPHRRTAPSHDAELDDDTDEAHNQPETQHQISSPIQNMTEDEFNNDFDDDGENQSRKVAPQESAGVLA